MKKPKTPLRFWIKTSLALNKELRQMRAKVERYEKALKEIESLTKHANYSTASENSYRAFLDTVNHIAKEALEGAE
jgi:hypothetical protein